MNDSFKIGDRLLQCANFVPLNSRLVDVGTDHAYLPIWLLKKGIITSAIAADVNIEPLESAKKNAKKYDVDIKTVLSNGFENIDEDEFDCAVIAGMGGELISNIISNADYLKNENKKLILQPMSKASKLREYLWENGFYLIDEQAVKHKGKIYSVMLVSYGQKQELCKFMGAIKRNSNYSKEYAMSVLNDLKNSLKGASLDDAPAIENKISEIERMYIDD